ncbi:Quinate permease [Penicillium rolfsii]|nr:Quinate permease [Penicillium rolfsii]
MPGHVSQSSRSRTAPPQFAQSAPSGSIGSSWQTQISNWWNYTSVSIASYSQIPQNPELVDNQSLWGSDENLAMEALRLSKARWRTYWLAAVLCCGGALFGYDSGVIGGVLTFESFQDSFQFTAAQKTRVSSIAVGIQQAGALAGCFIIWPVTNWYGRRIAMMLCSLLFCFGVVLEVIDTHSLPVFYVGRVICGLGIGGSATIIPIYMSEMSPKEIRGQLGSCYQLTYTIGILVSSWIDYGVKALPRSARQWQLPIGLQLVPGALMGLGMFSLDESVRWLLAHGKTAEAWRSMVWIRAGDGPAVMEEFEEMRHGLEEERHATAGFRARELLEWPNLHRLLIGSGLFLAQQSTGSTALAYFGPQFFALLVGAGDKNLLLTGIFGAIKVVACLLFVIFLSDRFGRRPLLASGAAFMSVCMLATAAVVKEYPPQDGIVTSAGVATVALIYLDIIAYNFSWGPLPWPCTSEIFPTRIREPGVAFGVGSQWLFNFIWSFSTPCIMAGLGWATFLLFGLLDILIVAFTFFFLKETAGKTLEEINEMFDGVNADAERGWKNGTFDTETEEDARNKRGQHLDRIDSVKSGQDDDHAMRAEQSTAGRT